MPLTFPCPNPVCTQLINAEAVQGAASLTCPSCGTKLDFRPQGAAPARAAAPKPAATGAKTAPPPTKPVAAASPKPAVKPPPARPAPPSKPASVAKPAVAVQATRSARPAPPPLPAKPIASPPPLATPVIPMASPVTATPTTAPNLAFSSQPDMVLTPRRRRAALPGWLVATLVVIPVFGGVGLLLFGFTRNWFSYGPSEGLTVEEKHGLTQQGNFRIEPPAKPWQQDKALQLSMKVNLAYRRSGPSSVMALVFKDYQKRQPRDAELIDEALNKVRGILNGMEYEIKPKGEQSKLAGQPAVLLEFQGEDPQHVQVNGECLTMAYRGIGYWYFTWAPIDDRDQLTGEWATLRDNFLLGDQREGWSEAKPKLIAVQGDRLPYKLEYAESLWEKQERDGYDSHADVVLLGYDPRDKEARRGDMTAVVQVLALDKAKDLPEAVKLAKDAVLEIEKEKQTGAEQYTFPGAVLEVVSDKALRNPDNDTDVGGFRGHIAKFKAKKSADHRKYVVLGVVRLEDGVLAIMCECAWERRDYWEQEFTPLLDKLKPAKGK